jgi:hypothetical protein
VRGFKEKNIDKKNGSQQKIKRLGAGERGGSAGGGSGSRLLRRGLIIIIETIRTLRGAAEPLMVE